MQVTIKRLFSIPHYSPFIIVSFADGASIDITFPKYGAPRFSGDGWRKTCEIKSRLAPTDEEQRKVARDLFRLAKKAKSFPLSVDLA